MALRHIYHPDMYRFERDPPTWWATTMPAPAPRARLDTVRQVDVAVIGAGYCGLSAALHLARDHGIEVAILDAARVGWGASGRNGGCNLIGATKMPFKAMVKQFGIEETRRFYTTQVEANALVEAIAADEGFDIDVQGDGLLAVAHHPAMLPYLKDYGEVWRTQLGLRAELLDVATFAERGYSGPEQHGGLHLWPGGALNPLKLVLGIAAAAERRGVSIFENSAVTAHERVGGLHHLATLHGKLVAKHVVYAMNAYQPDGLNCALDARVLPAIANIIVTDPIPDDLFAAHDFHTDTPVVDTRNLLLYFRKVGGNRLLFGARGDLRGDDAHISAMTEAVKRQFNQVFPKFANVGVAYFWRGLVAMSRSRAPSYGHLPDDPTHWYGFGCHGSGVNTQSWIGRELARNIAGVATDIPAVYRNLPPSLPSPHWLRRLGLGAAYAGYGAMDWLATRLPKSKGKMTYDD